jgi:hypothetical protein
MVKNIAALVFVSSLLIFGIIGVFFSHRVQAIGVSILDRGWSGGVDAVSAFVRSRQFLWNVRAVGLLSLLMGLLLLWIIVRRLLGIGL